MSNFWIGWLRFWQTFSQPWMVVCGFIVAMSVSGALAEVLKHVVRAFVSLL
jgi:CBS-domain-containing membrane protein